MYIFELIYKIFNRINNPQMKEIIDLEADYKVCEHIFVPVDSTKTVLACTKCGLIKKQKEVNPDI